MKRLAAAVLFFFAVSWFIPFHAPAVYAQATCTLNGQEVPCEELKEQVGTFLGFGVAALVIFGIIAIVSLVFWIVMLVHAASHPIENKNVWIVILVLLGAVGAIAYYVMVKREFDKKNPVSRPLVPPQTPMPQAPATSTPPPVQPPQNPPATNL